MLDRMQQQQDADASNRDASPRSAFAAPAAVPSITPGRQQSMSMPADGNSFGSVRSNNNVQYWTDAGSLGSLRQVHNVASITVEVADPEAQGDTVESTVKGAGGYVASNNLTTGADDGLKTDSMIVKVPVAQFETILGQIAKLGDVRAKNVTGEDITDKVSDAAQAENVLEDEVKRSDARLKTLGKKASWDDSESARDLRIQLAQARARLVLLRKLGEMSEIDVTLAQKPKAAAPPASGFVNDMSDSTKGALGSMMGAVTVLLTGVIWILVFAPIWVPLGLVGRWAYRRYRVPAA